MSLLGRLRLGRARRNCRLSLQRKLLEYPLPASSARVSTIEMVALDLETTGLDARRDHIVAAGWVLISGERILMSSAREVRVQNAAAKGVGQSATIHGIVDSDLVDADTAESMLGQLLPELAGRVIVAHAAPIERGFLGALLRRLGGVPLANPIVDTMAVERKLIEATGGAVRELHGDLTLDACRARHGLADYQRHSAGADALACAELLLAQLARLGGAQEVRLREIC